MMMENEESIYNLIPPQEYKAPKNKLHRSKHNPKAAPTGSTFCLKTTSKPGCSNLNGEIVPEGSNHLNVAGTGLWGKKLGDSKAKPDTFIKKGEGTMRTTGLVKTSTNYKNRNKRRAAVPKKDEKPIMGLTSDKNYIVANAVENILAAPKMKDNKDKDYTKKKEYGKTPKYLQKIKGEIDQEYELVREMQMEEDQQRDREKFLLPDDERGELIKALKKKWEVVHKQYQEITHVQKIDTVGLRRKKENCEEELRQLEKDIEKLSKKYIFVDTIGGDYY
mmetsp:Transcript_31430/g.27789  ORF Transcript_31430/g.27789 Transcript_31430/m.27789 type:complete len:277 (+) Transcript_31430:59-889(+)|eukprot:CAMPEP_0205823972 /NCGR_PEP_ID=MMETSP0206-20130828/18819_1 /ASSEMBLY_ACC=CAM_ASM_000279 /TAXON_ID=36767 /ORGANISM="Euplotes focardii, Strain TN1" /LENGTH=276 /DNA_ID=CAMNT_0053121645 /DNA_START=36 /DNA_END=866 /DNA_ORIENTATION=-